MSCNNCIAPKTICDNVETIKDNGRCYKECPLVGDECSDACGTTQMEVPCTDDDELSPTGGPGFDYETYHISTYKSSKDTQPIENAHENAYLQDITRNTRGTSAMFNKNEFVKTEGDNTMFYVTANGFKRIYVDDGSENHHETCKPFLKHIRNLKDQDDINQFASYDKIKDPMPIGQPCGFEGKSVGVLGLGGEFEKVGYVDDNGILKEFIDTSINNLSDTCPSSVVTIENSVWNAFKTGDAIKSGEQCEVVKNNSLRGKYLNSRQELRKNVSNMKKNIQFDVQNDTHFNNEQLNYIYDDMNDIKKEIQNKNALEQLLDAYNKYFKFHYILYFIIIVVLLSLLYYLIQWKTKKMSPMTLSPPIQANMEFNSDIDLGTNSDYTPQSDIISDYTPIPDINMNALPSLPEINVDVVPTEAPVVNIEKNLYI